MEIRYLYVTNALLTKLKVKSVQKFSLVAIELFFRVIREFFRELFYRVIVYLTVFCKEFLIDSSILLFIPG